MAQLFKCRLVWWILILLLAFNPYFGSGQSIYEDFETGFPNGRVMWSGDTGHYMVNSSGQLQLQSSGAGSSYVHTAILGYERMRWSAWVKMSFNTSANNYSTLVLLDDSINQMKLFLQMGGADDRIRLVANLGQSDTTLCIGTVALLNQSTNVVWVEVLYHQGLWWIKSSVDGLLWNNEASAFFLIPGYSGQTGIQSIYTSSNSTKFYFDEFLFEPLYPDTMPPYLTGWRLNNLFEMYLSFSEPVDTNSLISNSFRCSTLSPSTVLWNQTQQEAQLIFNTALPDREYLTFYIDPYSDTSGIWAPDTSFTVHHFEAGYGDISINEIMADPTPAYGLPESEYIELFNRTQFPCSLAGWKLQIGNTLCTLESLVIDSFSFLLLVRDLAGEDWGQGVTAIKLLGLSLPNTGSQLVLKDAQGRVIHVYSYSLETFESDFKAEGGWSLERRDAGNNSEHSNWKESMALKGGTPGAVNSVRAKLTDSQGPVALIANVISPWDVEVIFSESLDSSRLPIASAISFGSHPPPSIIRALGPSYDRLIISFNTSFEEDNVQKLECGSSVYDLNDNPSVDPWWLKAGMPADPVPGDIIINEVLFDPLPGQAEFIELFNASAKPLDLGSLVLCNFDTLMGSHTPKLTLSEGMHTMLPGEYIYFSRNTQTLVEYFTARSFPVAIRLDGLPTLSNQGACYSLATFDNVIIDSMCYNSLMHHRALVSSSGISLERLSSGSSGIESSSWHSSSTLGKGATPGEKNSQYFVVEERTAGISVSPNIFSPDNDGRDDFLILSWTDLPVDAFIESFVFDIEGRQVASLGPEGVSGNSGFQIWNGIDVSGNLLPAGIYLIKIKVSTSLESYVKRWAIGLRYE